MVQENSQTNNCDNIGPDKVGRRLEWSILLARYWIEKFIDSIVLYGEFKGQLSGTEPMKPQLSSLNFHQNPERWSDASSFSQRYLFKKELSNVIRVKPGCKRKSD